MMCYIFSFNMTLINLYETYFYLAEQICSTCIGLTSKQFIQIFCHDCFYDSSKRLLLNHETFNFQRDQVFMKKLFTDIVMESVYPLNHTANLPTYKQGNSQIEQVCNLLMDKK